MEYRVLGPLEVHNGQGSLPLAGAKQRALLALLLVHANHVLSRDRLIDGLWGNDPPETAVQSLQVYVSRLRKLLPAETLLTRPPGYLLAIAPDELDLQRFERLLAAGRETLGVGNPESASAILHEALALWRGPALAEFAFDSFAQAEIGRLEDLRLVAVEERIEADLALGRHLELIGELQALIAENPHRERLLGQLMLALYRAGRQADALDVYRSARGALDELGIEPGAELRRLQKAVLVQHATLAPPSPLVDNTPLLPGPLVPTPSFPFVGRESELATLRAVLTRAEAGEGGLVLLASQAGGGKTRLAREFALEALAGGALVLYGSPSATFTVPFEPVREWLAFLLRVCNPQMLKECLGAGGDYVSRLVPDFSALTGTSSAPEGDTGADRYLLQRALAEFLLRLSRRRSLVLVCDDMHWSDSGTLELLSRLARTAPEERMLVVTAFRDRGEEISAELSETLGHLSRLEGVTRLALGNFNNEEVSAFIRASTGAEAPDQLVSTIGDLTSGTPLLLCELWRDLVATGAVDVAHAKVSVSRPVAGLRGSERIHDLVRQRWSRLSRETSAMLEMAAVAGPRVELRILSEALGLDRRALVTSVEEAVAVGMLEELPDREPACRFTHELVRREIYDDIRRVRRPELHLRVGEALERIYAVDPADVLAELAHHFTLAVPVAGIERGVEYNLRAAEAATSTGAYHEAAARLSSALELGIADPSTRARVQAELGLLLYHSGRVGESEAILSATLDAATSLEERGLALRVLVHRAAQRMSSDPEVGSDEIVPIAERAIATFEQLGDPLGLAAAEELLGLALGREGRTEESFAALERALALAEAGGDQVLRRDVIGRMAMRLCDDPTPVGEAIQRLEKLRGATLDDPMLHAGVSRCLAVVLAMACRFDEAHEHITGSGPVLDGADNTILSLSSRSFIAEAKDLAGDPAGAKQDLLAAFLSMRDARGEGSESRALRVAAELALLCCDHGDWDEAADYLSYGRHVDQSEPPRGKVYAVLRLAARGRLAAQLGSIGEALELARHAVELAERTDWLNRRARVWHALAEVQRVNGNPTEADAAVATARRLYEAKGNVAAAARLRESAGPPVD